MITPRILLTLLTLTTVLISANIARAQTYQPSNRIPVADSTLGTKVLGNNGNFTIEGGLNRGQNLLHSFTDFSVPTGGGATFVNPVGNQSIITRVTGNLFSDINGFVNTQGANFLLINPNGMVFGPNARLNVGKAFVGTTANGVDLVDGSGRTITFGTNPNGDAPLLSVNPNVFFNVSRLNPGGGNAQISNFGTLQTDNPNQYIGLFGGNISMNGGKIEAPGGRVELGGLGDVLFTNQARINVAGSGGGEIAITARNLGILGGSILVGGIEQGLGTPATVAGDIKLNATGAILLGSNSIVGNNIGLNSSGNGGNIVVDTGSLFLLEGAQLQSVTSGQGNAGNIKVTAKDAVFLTGQPTAILSTVEAGAVGKGGTIDINAGSLSLKDGAQLATITREASTTNPTAGQGDAGNVKVKVTGAVDISGQNTFFSGIRSAVEAGTKGNGGNITIDAGSFSLRDGARLEASTYGIGNAGNVTLTAKNAVFLSGKANIFSTIEAGGVGKGGNIDINAGSLSIKDGAQLQTITRQAEATQPAGRGDAGNIKIEVTGAVDIAGKKDGTFSAIFSSVETGTVGIGGNININAGSFLLRDGAQLVASTYGKGNAGNITVTAKDAVFLAGQPTAIISAVEAGGVGKGGNIEINAGSLSLKDGAQLATITRKAEVTQPAGRGDAGNVKVKVSGAVDISGKKDTFPSGIRSLVETGTKGNGGNITIDAGSFLLRDGARFEASTYGQGNAGNVKITAKNAVSLTGSTTDIFSTIEAGGVGKGGNIDIKAGSLSLKDGAQLQTITREASSTNPVAGRGDAGNIKIEVTGTVDVAGEKDGTFSAIFSSVETGTVGTGGNININADSVSLRDGAQLVASTYGKGNAGNIKVTAKNTVSQIDGDILSTVEAGGVGNGGTIDINAGSLSLKDGAQLATITRKASTTQPAGQGAAGNVKVNVTGAVDISGKKDTSPSGIRSLVQTGTKGNGGNITIDAGSFSLRDGAEIIASTYGIGNAGNVTVTAKDAVSLTDANIFSTIEAGGIGKGGNIDIKAGSLSLKDSAQLQTIARQAVGTQPAGRGDAGNINVKVAGGVDLSVTKDGFVSAILSFVSRGTKGNGGNITIDAGSLSLNDGAQFTASTDGTGNAGTIKVNTSDFVTLSGKSGKLTSGLFVNSQSLTGTAGDIIVTSPKITLDNSGKIEAKSLSGNGGNITIGGQLKGESGFNQASKIDIANFTPTDLLILRRGGSISTNAEGTAQEGGNGGNININSNLIVALPKENSDISANAVKGKGGNVKIDSQGLFGIQFRAQPSDGSDITASSTFGQSGIVSIDTPGTDPGRDKGELSTAPNDASKQISQACSASQRDNKFYIIGRGGHPANAEDPLTSDVVWLDPRAAKTQPVTSNVGDRTTRKLAPPAVGWVFDGKGKVTLVAAQTEGEPTTGTRVVCPTEGK
jgi:filamentous hemagglutinin family protein